MKIEVLFITRNYLPQVGGLEIYSYNLIKPFEEKGFAQKIALTKSRIHLLWFLPYAFVRAIYLARKHSIPRVHLCDGLLSPMGVLLKLFLGVPVSVSIHGLDMTYENPIYQWFIPRCVGKLDKVICVSRATLEECVLRGIPSNLCSVIPNGINPDDITLSQSREDSRSELAERVGIPLEDKLVLLTVGRLVTRKGVAWFIENVMLRLPSSYVYIIAGDGPEYRPIAERLRQHGLQSRVFLLGKVSNEFRNLLFHASDIFVMPNVQVKGDMEGFGIVALEAGRCGLPVVASNIQGIRDAIMDGETGYLVGEKDIEGYIHRIETMDLSRESVRSIVIKTFNWQKIYERYRDVLLGNSGQKMTVSVSDLRRP